MRQHLRALIVGRQLPERRWSAEDEREGAVISAVPLIRDLGSTTRINVSLDLGLLKAIDEAAAARKQTRSAFLASAARRELVE